MQEDTFPKGHILLLLGQQAEVELVEVGKLLEILVEMDFQEALEHMLHSILHLPLLKLMDISQRLCTKVAAAI